LAREGGGPEGRGVGRGEEARIGGSFFFFDIIITEIRLAGWAGYYYHYYGNFFGA